MHVSYQLKLVLVCIVLCYTRSDIEVYWYYYILIDVVLKKLKNAWNKLSLTVFLFLNNLAVFSLTCKGMLRNFLLKQIFMY